LPAAQETPFQTYRANSIAETVATRFTPSTDGAISPYAWAGSFVCSDATVHEGAIKALRKLVETTPVYHPLTGLADVYYPDVARAAAADKPSNGQFAQGTRQEGMWVNYTSFGIDQGPIALGLNLALCQIDGTCTPRLAGHPTVVAAVTNASCKSTGWVEGEWAAIGACRRSASSTSNRCNPLACETGISDNFPQRVGLSGGQAAQIFQAGTALTFDGLRIVGPASLTIDYSLSWPADKASQVVLLACLDATSGPGCVTIPNLAPTTSWTTSTSLPVAFPASSATTCSSVHSLNLVLQSTPEPTWGIQIDRIRLDGQ
jgi:hypothetical protein